MFPITQTIISGLIALVILIVGVLVGGTILTLFIKFLVRLAQRKITLPIQTSETTQAEQTLTPTQRREYAAQWMVQEPEAKNEELTTSKLIEKLRTIDWFQFEKLVARMYANLGYSVERRGGANPDGGIDLIIEKEGQRIAIQCKQWKKWTVGVRAIREFVGALTVASIDRGIFVTLCGYTGEAKQLAESRGITILNETGLAAMLEQTGARLDPETLLILNDDRKLCPKCEREMVVRVAKKGKNPGERFWGCSTFPKCNAKMPYTD